MPADFTYTCTFLSSDNRVLVVSDHGYFITNITNASFCWMGMRSAAETPKPDPLTLRALAHVHACPHDALRN